MKIAKVKAKFIFTKNDPKHWRMAFQKNQNVSNYLKNEMGEISCSWIIGTAKSVDSKIIMIITNKNNGHTRKKFETKSYEKVGCMVRRKTP